MEEVGEKMEEKVWQYMQKHHMITEKDRIVAGISGGGDSMALLFLLQKMRSRMNFQICAVHVNHGIRGPEAERDEKFVADYCLKNQIPCRVFHYQIPEIAKEKGWGEEEAGRQMRQEAYRKVMREWNGTKIALAHHQNDQAETLIHHLARGCGMRGMRGMLPVQGRVIRPFLCIDRKEIEHYLNVNQIPYHTDSSNRSDQYIRNRIRNHVVNYLQENVNSKTVEHLAETASIASEAEAYISEQAERVRNVYVKCHRRKVQISQEIEKEPHIIRIYILMQALEQLYGQRKDISREHLEQILGLFQKETGKRIRIHGAVDAYRDYDGISLERAKKKEKTFETLIWDPASDGRIQWCGDLWEANIFCYKSQKILEKTYTKWFDYDKIESTLQIRNRTPGDFIVVTSQGGKKKLKDYLINEKIPQQERDGLILLAQGQEILWIVGMRISEAYKITESTKRVLEVNYQGGWGIE